VQHLKEAFASFFAAGRASPIAEAAPALLPDTDTDKTAPSSSASASSFLAGIVKPDADLDVWNLSKVDAKESTTDLDELECQSLSLSLSFSLPSLQARWTCNQAHREKEQATELTFFSSSLASCTAHRPHVLAAILADVNELFLQLTTEIYNAYTNLSNLQGHTLAGLLVDISAHESEQGAPHDSLAGSFLTPSREWIAPIAHTISSNKPPTSSLAASSNACARVYHHFFYPPRPSSPYRRTRLRGDRQLSRALARDAWRLAAARTCPRSGIAFTFEGRRRNSRA
jgi:hypothetical protein